MRLPSTLRYIASHAALEFPGVDPLHGMVSGASVLVIDDHEDSLEVLALMLKRYGLKVGKASNTTRGLALARKLKPDLILCDLMMPRSDGFDFMRRLKSHASIAHIPVVAVTALTEDAAVMRTWQAGFAAHVTKPITADVLEAQLWRAFGTR